MKDAFYTLLIITIILFSHPGQLVAQNTSATDSLKTVIVNQKDTPQKVDNFLSIAQEFAHSNADSCFLYLDKAIELATRINYKAGLGEAYFMESYSYDVLGNYPKSISSLEKSIELFVETKDSSYLSGCYNNLGVLYSYGSDQKKSLEYFIKSISIGEALRDSFSLAEAYSNVAGFYEERKEYSLALKYYKKALEIDKNYNYPEDIAISEVDVAYMNIKLLRYDDALKNLERARELMIEVDDPYYKTIVLQRFAQYYKETGELTLAANEIIKAQQLIDLHDYPMLTLETLETKAEILIAEEQYAAAVLVIDEVIRLSEQIDSKSVLPELYELKAESLFGLGSYKKGYDNFQMAKEFRDALQSNEVAEYLSEFETHEALKEERTRLFLEQELENQRNEFELIKMRSKLYFTIVLAVFLGLLMSIALYLFILKQNHAKKFESNFALINHQKELIEKNYYELKENEKRLSELNATKDKFFSIIAHDLKNPFNTLIGVSEIMLIDPDIKNSDDFDDFVKGMHETAKGGYDLLDNLLQWSRSQIGSIQFEPKNIAIDKTISHVSSMFKETSKAKNITISRLGERNREVYADENMLNFILRNLINNAIKFSPKNEEIEVDTYNEKESIVFRVIDYGIGMSEKTIAKLFKIEHSVQRPGTANEKGTGLGLILCKEFVEKNGGEIWVESEEGKGSIFHFSLPQAPSS